MKWCCIQDHSPCFSIEDKGSDAAAIKKYIKMDPAAQIVPLKEFDQIAMHTHEKLPGDNKFLANPSKKEFDAATTTSTSTTLFDYTATTTSTTRRHQQPSSTTSTTWGRDVDYFDYFS